MRGLSITELMTTSEFASLAYELRVNVLRVKRHEAMEEEDVLDLEKYVKDLAQMALHLDPPDTAAAYILSCADDIIAKQERAETIQRIVGEACDVGRRLGWGNDDYERVMK